MTEEQETEDITMKPSEEEELASRSHSVERTEKRTVLVAQEVGEKGCRENGSQDREHFLFPLSQNSLGKYVPVFPKLKSRLSRHNPVRNDVEIQEKESLNNSKVEGDSSPQNMDLENSGLCLPAAKHQLQALTKLTNDEVQPGDKDYELQLFKPTLENKAVTDLSVLNAPQEDNANFASDLEDLHLSESDWQTFSPSTEEEEDATHVVCGLINELSKINRVIMITRRELESMRRHKNRRVRSVGRHPHISKGATNVPYSVKRKDL
ncbi:uncharacterized protein LOC121271191 isoform X2 [Carcharodon carcharias]|uniref:uncharacterized protein LOC121271191 isoform X2 n=1 Tax=Carcharodon carcharias TaxID=13397 RepID=UPI001B7DF98B|nr:uncharacterized protein LOC121271191 isoform X2 [Carcharodon carcharias]